MWFISFELEQSTVFLYSNYADKTNFLIYKQYENQNKCISWNIKDFFFKLRKVLRLNYIVQIEVYITSQTEPVMVDQSFFFFFF